MANLAQCSSFGMRTWCSGFSLVLVAALGCHDDWDLKKTNDNAFNQMSQNQATQGADAGKSIDPFPSANPGPSANSVENLQADAGVATAPQNRLLDQGSGIDQRPFGAEDQGAGTDRGSWSDQGSATDMSSSSDLLCPGLAAEYALQGESCKETFVEACIKTPICADSVQFIDTNKCSQTVQFLKSLSRDFRDACENGTAAANLPTGVSDPACTQACIDLFDCAVSDRGP
jgi:hypothetical protein